MFSLFITAAHAADGAAPASASTQDMIMSFLPMILIVAIFYFLLIRPQQKRMKEHSATIAALQKGDHIILGGGIKATVVKIVDDHDAIVEVADGVKLTVVRATIASVVQKSNGVSEKAPAKKAAAKKPAAKAPAKKAAAKKPAAK